MSIEKEFLKEIWNSVWEEGLTELEVQRKYFTKLEKILKGEDRFYLTTIKRKIDELEIETPFTDLLANRMSVNNHGNKSVLQSPRAEGDGTEWLFEKDDNGNIYKRAIGSDEKVYINENGDDLI